MLAELEAGIKLVSPNDPTKPRWERLLAECRRLIKLDPRLDRYLKGEIKPGGAGESCELALFVPGPAGAFSARRPGFMSRPLPSSLAAPTDLRLGYRYHAAGCAARAASGKGRDSQTTAERTHWREKALEWLQADLSIRREQIQKGTSEQARDAKIKLRYWLNDPQLADVRDEQALQEMTEAQCGMARAVANDWRSCRQAESGTRES